MMAATSHMGNQYGLMLYAFGSGLTAATGTENDHLSIAEVTIEGLSDVEALEGGIALVDNGGRSGADCSSEGREEGDQASRDHFDQEIPDAKSRGE